MSLTMQPARVKTLKPKLFVLAPDPIAVALTVLKMGKTHLQGTGLPERLSGGCPGPAVT